MNSDNLENDQCKELSLFNQLDENYLNNLLYFELDSSPVYKLDEKLIDEIKQSTDKIQNVYILYGNRSMLIISKNSEYNQEILDLISHIEQYKLINKQIQTLSRLQLVTELIDTQLSLINSNDKSAALKYIESKTGLKFKKIKKQFFFTGYLFQFNILNQIFCDLVSNLKHLNQTEQLTNDWMNIYNESNLKFNFKINNNVNVFIFQADLTELNTDCIINATNPNLHPGYVGDGVSRRIREKGGKQMQDACKKLLLTQPKHLFNDSDACVTKSSGRLKCKYVLHSVCPTWTKYIIETAVNQINTEIYENLIENMFLNILKQANDPQLNLTSIAFPIESNSSGGAFDLPIELFSHIFYRQIWNYYQNIDMNNTKINTICLCSSELKIVNELIDLFQMYSETCSTTLWTLPESPMLKLVQQVHPNYQVTFKLQETTAINTNTNIITNINERVVLQNNTNTMTNNQKDLKLTNAATPNNHMSNLDASCCLFCQKENNSLNTSTSLVCCGNDKCKSSFCESCLYNYVNRQHTNKCPSCRLNIDKCLLQTINNNYNSSSSSSSSSSISPTRVVNQLNQINQATNQSQLHRRLTFPTSQQNQIQNQNQSLNNNNNNNICLNSNSKYPITDGKIFIRKLDEPCAGYEKYKSILITFEISDGIQNEKQPKPGQMFKGTTKRAYLPEIREHKEILAFYEKALKSGMLFRLEWSRNYGDYRVHLNQDVLLKTSQSGGGRFGYPDMNYIDDLLYKARNFKS